MRLSITKHFAQLLRHNALFKSVIVEQLGWTPQTPLIPSEWGRQVEDILRAADSFFSQGYENIVLTILSYRDDQLMLLVTSLSEVNVIPHNILKELREVPGHLEIGQAIDLIDLDQFLGLDNVPEGEFKLARQA